MMTLADFGVLAGSLAFLALFHGWLYGPRRGDAALATGGASGFQEATIVVKGGYSPDRITVRQGTPVRLRFRREEDSACTDRVVMPAFGINRELPAFAETAVDFTPQQVGDYDFACGMNMVHGTVSVVAAPDPKGASDETR